MPSEDTQFKAGNPGGPGRPKGSRNKLSEDFLRALANDFAEHGVKVIEQLRAEQPAVYFNGIGKLMPKLMELSGPDGEPIAPTMINYVPVEKDDTGSPTS